MKYTITDIFVIAVKIQNAAADDFCSVDIDGNDEQKFKGCV